MPTRLYLRPTGFVDAPFGHDGKVLRLGGGLAWFGQVEVIRVEQGRRVDQALVAVERLDGVLDDAGRAVLARLIAPRPQRDRCGAPSSKPAFCALMSKAVTRKILKRCIWLASAPC